MVFKLTGSISRFHRKYRFRKVCIESRGKGENMSNFAGLDWRADFGQFFCNILGLRACFSKPIFAWKPWDRAGQFEYHESYNRNNYFSLIKASEKFWGHYPPKLKRLEIKGRRQNSKSRKFGTMSQLGLTLVRYLSLWTPCKFDLEFQGSGVATALT